MRQDNVTTTVYKFSELSETAKEKALEKLYHINLDFEWWEFCYGDFHEQLKAHGLRCKTFYFSLDRDKNIQASGLGIEDSKLLLSHIQDKNLSRLKNLIDLTVDTRRYCWTEAYTIGQYRGVGYRRIDAALENIASKCDRVLNDLLDSFLDALQREYDYLSSKEAIIETIEANEYEFTESGTIY